MAKEDIAKANATRTPQKRRANASKAGKASGEARRRRKTLKEVFGVLMDMDISSESVEEVAAMITGINKTITVNEAMALAMIGRALKGDVPAFNAVRDTSGEKPTEQHEVDATIRVELGDAEELAE